MLSYILKTTIYSLLQVVELMRIARAIMSWFPVNYNGFSGKLVSFLHMVTEPIIAPVRNLLYKWFPSLQGFPLDISFLVVFILIQMVGTLIIML